MSRSRRPGVVVSVAGAMVAVAVVAVALGAAVAAWRAGPRAQRYRELADEHARIEARCRHDARVAAIQERQNLLQALPELTVGTDDNRYHRDVLGMRIYWFGPGRRRRPEQAGRWRRLGEPLDRAAYHAGLRRRYDRAASRPWEAIGTDPAPPWTRNRRAEVASSAAQARSE